MGDPEVIATSSEALEGLDVAGLIRRVRRVADLSQRELARRLGVGHATVGRWESGRGTPGLDQLTALFGLAGLRIAALDEGGAEVWAMPGSDPADGALRDNGDRLYPAHLDLEPDATALDMWWEAPRPDRRRRRLVFRHRQARDRRRARFGTPATQPTRQELRDWMDALWCWRRHRLANGRPRVPPLWQERPSRYQLPE